MSQNRRIISSIVFASLALLFGLTAAGAAPLLVRTTPSGSSAAKSLGGDAEAAFQMIVPAELEQQVTIKPSWLPLSKQLTTLQNATKVPLSLHPSVPDDVAFVAAPGRTEFSLLRQVRLLLTNDQWQSQWVYKDLGKDHRSYRLWREAVSPQARRAKMAQVAKERLAKLLSLLQAGPQAWDELRKGDPDMSSVISQPIIQAPLLLAGELSPEQLSTVLMGQPLTLPVANMSPQDQELVRKSLGNVVLGNGATIGAVVFTASPLGPGATKLGLSMTDLLDSTYNPYNASMGGFEMLYMDDTDFAPEEKQQIAARHRQEAADALAAKTPGAKTVTIDKDAKPEPGEPPLAAYLRAFAEQTNLTVLAHWPSGGEALTDSKGQPKGLPASIVNRPAGEALDLLCKTYGGEWVQDEATVRLRALPVPEPLLRRPAVTKPAPGGSPGR